MNGIQEVMKPVEQGAQGWLWDRMRTPVAAPRRAVASRERGVVEEARGLLQRAVRGSSAAAADLQVLKPDLNSRARLDPQACEILAAMSASGLGTARNPGEAREWIMRAIRLLEDRVRRPVAGNHGFMLVPAEEPRNAYRPLYTAEGVLVTDEIGIARTEAGEICFDRWGRPVLTQSSGAWGGPTRTPRDARGFRLGVPPHDPCVSHRADRCARDCPRTHGLPALLDPAG
jgi:hypothetical protein